MASFDAIRTAVRDALEVRHPSPDPPEAVPFDKRPWISEINQAGAIYEVGRVAYWVPYTLKEVDGRLTAELGEAEPVEKRWATAGGRTVALEDRGEWVDVYHAFPMHLADAGDQAESDGLVWKEVVHPGTFFKTDTGRSVEVTADIIASAYQAWKDGLPRYISVPSDSHWPATRGIVPPEHNKGFVKKLKLVDGALYAGFEFTDPVVADGVTAGGIADVSVYLQPGVVHPKTGKEYPWVLRHVLLTNNPLVSDLKPWGDVPIAAEAGGGGVVVEHYQAGGPVRLVMDHSVGKEEVSMPNTQDGLLLDEADEIVLTGEAKAEYAALARLGLSVEKIMALAETSAEIVKRSRELELEAIEAALEGRGTHAAVKSMPGYRHNPVVVEAVLGVLGNPPEALALADTDDGATFGAVRDVALAVVNAIPAEGRIKVEGVAPVKSAKPASIAAKDSDGKDLTPEKIDAFLAEIGA